jgi:hypothetical protein
MAAKGTLVGLPAETLTEMRDAMVQGILASMARGTSYTIAGRSFTFPGLSEAQSMIEEANYALGLLSGNRSRVVRSNFNPSMGRGSLG